MHLCKLQFLEENKWQLNRVKIKEEKQRNSQGCQGFKSVCYVLISKNPHNQPSITFVATRPAGGLLCTATNCRSHKSQNTSEHYEDSIPGAIFSTECILIHPSCFKAITDAEGLSGPWLPTESIIMTIPNEWQFVLIRRTCGVQHSILRYFLS